MKLRRGPGALPVWPLVFVGVLGGCTGACGANAAGTSALAFWRPESEVKGPQSPAPSRGPRAGRSVLLQLRRSAACPLAKSCHLSLCPLLHGLVPVCPCLLQGLRPSPCIRARDSRTTSSPREPVPPSPVLAKTNLLPVRGGAWSGRVTRVASHTAGPPASGPFPARRGLRGRPRGCLHVPVLTPGSQQGLWKSKITGEPSICLQLAL